jgi:CheY-like chemotaxis protein
LTGISVLRSRLQANIPAVAPAGSVSCILIPSQRFRQTDKGRLRDTFYDHAVFRGGLRLLLDANQGVTIIGEAQNGEGGIKLLAKLKPDILLLDLRMPDKSGLAVLEKVNFDTLPIRAVILTAAEDDRDVVRAMRLGARGVILKQSATDLLVKSIHHEGEAHYEHGIIVHISL